MRNSGRPLRQYDIYTANRSRAERPDVIRTARCFEISGPRSSVLYALKFLLPRETGIHDVTATSFVGLQRIICIQL